MQRTPNLGLPQFEPSDKYRLEDYNEAYMKIDEKIKELKDKEAQLNTKLAEAQSIIDTWTQFKNSGGDIGGNVTAYQVHAKDSVELDGFGYVGHSNEDAIEIVNPQGGKKTRLVSKDNAGYYLAVELDGNDGAFKPNTHGIVDLGTPFINFKNLYLAGYSLGGNGYTKLPNGLIMQWGKVLLSGGSDGGKWQFVGYPISFPTSTLNVQLTQYSGDDYHNVKVAYYENGGFMLHGVRERNYNWIAIGY